MGETYPRKRIVERTLMKVEKITQIVVKDETRRFELNGTPELIEILYRWKSQFATWNSLSNDFEFRYTYRILQ